MPDMTRRRLLGSAAGAVGGAAALSLLPASVQQAVAAGPAHHGSLADIEHVVLLMQENRSFDHYFGTLPGVRGFADPHARDAATPAGRSSTSPTRRTRTATCCRSTWTPSTTSAQAIPSTQPRLGGAARGVERRQDGQLAARAPRRRRGQRPVRDGLLHPRGHPVPVRAGRDVHHLRRLLLLGDGPDLAQPDVLDDRHDRRRTARSGGPIISNSAPARRLPLDHLRGAAPGGRGQLEGLPAGRQLRLQHAGALRSRSSTPRRATPLYDSGHGGPAGGHLRGRRAQRPAAGRLLDHLPTSTQSEHPDYLPAAGADFVASQDRGDRRQPEGVGEDRVHPQLRRERRPVRPRRAADPARRTPPTSSSRGCRSAAGSGCRASSSRRGRWAAGWPASRSTTPRCCSSWSASPGSTSPTSASGAAGPSAT